MVYSKVGIHVDDGGKIEKTFCCLITVLFFNCAFKFLLLNINIKT